MIPSLITIAVVTVIILGLTGCAYTSTWRTTELGRSLATSAEPALVTLSFTERKAGQRGPFFHQVQSVLADLPSHEGLLGYAFRFELLGTKAWTVTAWRDSNARDQFVYASAHSTAMSHAGEVLERSAFRSLRVPPRELPLPWTQVLAHLAEQPKPAQSSTSHPSSPQP